MPKPLSIRVGHYEVSSEEKSLVREVLESGQISPGPKVRAFEEAFADAHASRFGLMVDSGTAALQIAVACLKEAGRWKDGDEVLVPAVTFVATTNVVLQLGLKPVFVDVDAKTYTIDPNELKKHLTRRTRAIIPVHLFGQPCDMTGVMAFARRHKLKVVEDSCEAMFVSHRGQSVGSFGDIACFSTYVAHLLTTGVGGLAITNNPRYALIMRSLANHGRDSIYIPGYTKAVPKNMRSLIARRFRFVRSGYSFRATEFQAALGLAQLAKKDAMLEGRLKVAQKLMRGLRKHEAYLQLPTIAPENTHAFMMFPIVIRDARVKKGDLTLYLEEHGIETRDMLPLINQPIYTKRYGALEKKYPVARWINHNGFYVGSHPGLTEEDTRYMVDVFASFFREKGL